MYSIPRYRQSEVLEYLPMLKPADLQNWVVRGTLRLDNPAEKPRRFSLGDLIALACMWEMRQQHIPPAAAATIAHHAKIRARSWAPGCRPCVFFCWWAGEKLRVVTEYTDQAGERLARNTLRAEPAVIVFTVDDLIESVHDKIAEVRQWAA